ncbi:ATP-binding protein [Herbaspirillum sp. YR522]|uniref:ATP-binding protein n=1 Tax=Herbaspirillum sp. YR522 TaxID=1144342 RepID=UPI00026F64B6|nr:ATP-binding protein [Herbaspirillum sp. YR522]EJN10124.1 hypothetical protein PMI40_00211 [Herbaspirillum sp. YR522]
MEKSNNNKSTLSEKAPRATKSAPTELTGGKGFTYEDKVVAYYLAALLRAETAMGQQGTVSSVAVQWEGRGQPMDDLIVEFVDTDGSRILALQVKSSLRITGAATNKDFRDIIKKARQTQQIVGFQPDRDVHGYVVEHIAEDPHRSLNRLISWAKSSPTASDFDQRFTAGGAVGSAEKTLRDTLAPLIEAQDLDDEWNFYRQFVATRLNGLEETGVLWAEITNRLQELVESDEDGQAILLWDRLCRIVRDGAGTGRKWTRATLLAQLRGVVRLKVAPNFRNDVDILSQFSIAGLNEIGESIDGFEVDRSDLQQKVLDRLERSRVVNISGLPGCGKSVVLKRIAKRASEHGPILFFKSDRLTGKSWVEFSAALRLDSRKVDDLLAEIGATGTATLYIDGIDRINPDQKRIILDVLATVERNPDLGHWKVLATSRDQGLETYRAWFPVAFYSGTQIGDVQVAPFDDREAETLAKEKPGLRHVLMGPKSVQAIARRPFFAAVLARSLSDSNLEPQTEVDLINAWWTKAGHDAPAEVAPQRQRALLDIAEKGVANLGKDIAARSLAAPTFGHIAALKSDLVVRGNDGDSSFSFTHDIFFEWAFFRLLIDLGESWIDGLTQAGEPPLLGRVVGLLAQHSIDKQGKWTAGYMALDRSPLRPQWRREWLTAVPFTSAFSNDQKEFTDLVTSNDYLLLEKVLVWFQAQHTIPNPTVLLQTSQGKTGIDRLGLAEMLSWPSDFSGWRRFLDWLLPIASKLPIRLVPTVVEVFSVWQNALSDIPNQCSKTIVSVCDEWLVEIEKIAYSATWISDRGRWEVLGSDAQKQLATALRIIIVKAARVHPEYANALYERAISNKRMREDAYSDLMALTWIIAEISPNLVAAVTKAELQEELPQDYLDREARQQRERTDRIKQIRDKPEKERTESERRALEHSHFHIPRSYVGMGRDDIGIDRYHNYYFPTSAKHEPFAHLFSKTPEVALELVRDLSNHGTTGWRQIAQITRYEYGTPIPVTIEFPWGEQKFWGDWPAYNWQLGQLGPQPLECAYLALSYWAFHQIENGRPVDDVIKSVVQGNESIASAGLALRLALETLHISEVTLSLVSCQRLWPFDIARVRNEPTRHVDLLGMGNFHQLTGDKKAAEEYLDKRLSRFRDVRELAKHFMVNGRDFTAPFRQALANFVIDLPYQIEEERTNSAVKSELAEQATEYSALATVENYQLYRTTEEKIVVAYQPPLSAEAIDRSEAAGVYLQQNSVLAWAMKSLRAAKPSEEKSLADAVALARPLDEQSLFIERLDVQDHMPQSVVAAVAACVICFGDVESNDYKWAMTVLERIDDMKEPAGTYGGEKITWHPALHLIFALLHLRRVNPSSLETAQRLVRLTSHWNEGVEELAFAALFVDPITHVSWVAAQLALETSWHYRPTVKNRGVLDTSVDEVRKKLALDRALTRLDSSVFESFTSLPPAWIRSTSESENEDEIDNDGWIDPDPSFDAKRAARWLRKFPVATWCASNETKSLVFEMVKGLVSWTAQRIQPLADAKKKRRHRADLVGWNDAFGEMLAHTAPFFGVELMKTEVLAPFLQSQDDNELDVMAAFTNRLVTLQVMDAGTVPSGTFELLNVCADYVIANQTFQPGGYRGGEVSGQDLPRIIDALLAVNAKNASGAARFANGNWSDISLIMPVVTRLMTATGWSTFVMTKFLLLCQRAGESYPLDSFIEQISAPLRDIDNARGNWAGTSLASKIAAAVQRLADANFPLRADQAQGLLWILDALVDLGDRRSVALEQSEAFKGVKAASLN